MHYYESFDPKADGGIGVPKKKKGTVPVHNAKITTFPHKGDSKQKFCFVMEHRVWRSSEIFTLGTALAFRCIGWIWMCRSTLIGSGATSSRLLSFWL